MPKTDTVCSTIEANKYSLRKSVLNENFEYFFFQLAGASYMEVHQAGGGIHFTVDKVRKASEDHLYEEFRKYMMRMLQAGMNTYSMLTN